MQAINSLIQNSELGQLTEDAAQQATQEATQEAAKKAARKLLTKTINCTNVFVAKLDKRLATSI